LRTCYTIQDHNNWWGISLKENIQIKSIRLSFSSNYTNSDYTLKIRSDRMWKFLPKPHDFKDLNNRISTNIHKSNEIISSNSIKIDSYLEVVLCEVKIFVLINKN
jgi:hypothetical protein